MAVTDVSSEHAVTSRLYDLLHHARVIKRSTSIDPPLQVSALVDDDGPLVAFSGIGEESRNSLVEGAAKKIFYASVVSCN
jgi:THO complex subunit 1